MTLATVQASCHCPALDDHRAFSNIEHSVTSLFNGFHHLLNSTLRVVSVLSSMPSATQLGWMDWPCPYKRISKFNNPTSETYEYDAPMEDILDVGSKPEAPGLKKHAACDECRLFTP
jgi:hypothetical protein